MTVTGRSTPEVRRAAAAETRLAQAAPYARPVTVWRDALSGRFAQAPTGPGVQVGIDLPAPAPASDLTVFSYLIDWEDGSAPEVVRVSVESGSARVAQFLGELTGAAVRDFEGELSLDALREVNPGRAREAELGEMHAAHRSAKSKRGAHSRVRNAKARAAEAQRKGKR